MQLLKENIFSRFHLESMHQLKQALKPYFVAHFNENSQAWMLNPHMSQAAFLQGATTETTP